MRSIFVPVLMLFLLSGCEYFSGNRVNLEELPEFSKQYNPSYDPQSDLEFAISIASESNRRILMIVGGDWCPWCRSMDKFFKENSDLNALLHENFVVLKVYYGKENYNSRFLSGFPRLIATPHFYILDSDGSTLHSQETEVLEKGRSYDKLKVTAFLQRWLPVKP